MLIFVLIALFCPSLSLVRLITGHAFIGSYAAHFLPWKPIPCPPLSPLSPSSWPLLSPPPLTPPHHMTAILTCSSSILHTIQPFRSRCVCPTCLPLCLHVWIFCMTEFDTPLGASSCSSSKSRVSKGRLSKTALFLPSPSESFHPDHTDGESDHSDVISIGSSSSSSSSSSLPSPRLSHPRRRERNMKKKNQLMAYVLVPPLPPLAFFFSFFFFLLPLRRVYVASARMPSASPPRYVVIMHSLPNVS
jgi:hypothetical protein